MCLTDYIPDLIGGAFTIFAALIAVSAGVWGFFRQKEYELVQRRYLEEGLDVLIATAENSLNTFLHNWSRSIELLKSFRDVDTMKPEELDHGFLHLPVDRFALTANFRVNQITNSSTVWRAFQLVVAFSQRGSTIARDEIPAMLRMKLTSEQIESTREEIVELATEELKKLNEESHHYHVFIAEMQDIARLVEEQKLSLKQIRKLQDHEIVKKALRNLDAEYADKLSTHNKAAEKLKRHLK